MLVIGRLCAFLGALLPNQHVAIFALHFTVDSFVFIFEANISPFDGFQMGRGVSVIECPGSPCSQAIKIDLFHFEADLASRRVMSRPQGLPLCQARFIGPVTRSQGRDHIETT